MFLSLLSDEHACQTKRFERQRAGDEMWRDLREMWFDLRDGGRQRLFVFGLFALLPFLVGVLGHRLINRISP